MSTAAVEMVTGLTTVMGITQVVHPIWVVVNPHRITRAIIPIVMRHTVLGVLVVMGLNIVIGVLEDVKEL